MTNFIYSISSYFYQSLGHRQTYWVNTKEIADPYVPGFIKIYSQEIAALSLTVPIFREIFRRVSSGEGTKDLTLEKVKEFAKSLSGQIKEEATTYHKPLLAGGAALLLASSLVDVTVLAKNLTALLNSNEVVIGSHLVLGTMHTRKLGKYFKNKDKISGMKHLFAASISWMTAYTMKHEIYPLRWHHISYGLASMLPSLSALNFFGLAMVNDSILYWCKPMKDNYDFSNIFVENLGFYLSQLTILSFLEANYFYHLKKDNKAVPSLSGENQNGSTQKLKSNLPPTSSLNTLALKIKKKSKV